VTDTRLDKYRGRIASGGGLLAWEWDHFDTLEKQLEPDAYAARQAAGSRRIAIGYARSLTVEDLQSIIDEKVAMALSSRECK
jgi:hypothetical protein